MFYLFKNDYYALSTCNEQALIYEVLPKGKKIEIAWPSFEIDGMDSGAPHVLSVSESVVLKNGVCEIKVACALKNGAALTMTVRVCDATPIIRFRYSLKSNSEISLTKKNGEKLCYFTYASDENAQRTEIRFANYDQLVHGYTLNEVPAFLYEDALIGPILTEQAEDICMLTAYEHGSTYPDKFVAYERVEGGIALKAQRGNYWNGESICERPYETIWLQLGAVAGDQDALANLYRTFQLKYCTMNMESRKPYIFYNTWAFQERNKFYNKQAYLTSMNEARIEQEIEIAHKMGVDVFVIDTGWYQKTGDWETNEARFPHGMKHIAEKLESCGMKLGLWFGPTEAALSSRILKDHPNAIACRRGKEPKPFPVWETEESYSMCLVSEYWEAFADELIRLAGEVGVRYFKWDAVGMYDCERGNHFHGGPDSSAEESRDCYAFNSGIYLSKIVDKLCSAYPDAIVDMDMTEENRYFGLGFLSSGKFFSMNNGPYYPNYDITVPDDQWINIFVNPGPARGWICRQNLSYDKWIPSVLLMAHYLPDDPKDSQMLNLASLILGQNGIWGDLPNVSEEGVQLFGEVLSTYKRVRDDITQASPFTFGRPGETIELHEKINPENGRGVVVLFSNKRGEYECRLHGRKFADQMKAYGNIRMEWKNGSAYIKADFDNRGAAILFFE